jgi:hypothetical protein
MSAPAPVLGIDARQAEEKRWATKEKIVDALAREVQSDGAQLLFAAYAGREEPNSTIEEISRHMEPLASTKGFYYHNLVPFVFTQEIERGEKAAFLPCDGHWSPSGHRFVAQSLYEYLSRNPHLLQKK